MRTGSATRFLVFSFLAALSLCLAQEGGALSPYGEKGLGLLAERYGITGSTRHYRESGQPEISTVGPLLSWLDARYGGHRFREQSGGAVLHFTRPFSIVLGEDTESLTFEGGEVQVRLSKSFEGAEKAAALYLGNLAVRFDKGPFSGTTVGDWSASRNDHERRAALVFLRKNVFVKVFYEAATEVSKRDRTRRQDRDPSIRQKCEALARAIDEQVGMLPRVEAK